MAMCSICRGPVAVTVASNAYALNIRSAWDHRTMAISLPFTDEVERAIRL